MKKKNNSKRKRSISLIENYKKKKKIVEKLQTNNIVKLKANKLSKISKGVHF